MKKLFAMLVCLLFPGLALSAEFFGSFEECEAAVQNGTAKFYAPHARRPDKVTSAKSSGKYSEEKYDTNVCVSAWVAYPESGKAGSRKWVAQPKGTAWLAEKEGGNAANRGLMDLCANDIYEVRAVREKAIKPISAMQACQLS